MDEDRKKLIIIISAVVCIVLATTITIINMGGRGGGLPRSKEVHMLCDSCEATYTLTSEEFREQMRQLGAGREMMMMRGPMLMTCKECGEYAAYRAIKCPKCDEIFVEGDAEDEQYPDRCPACDHSPIEQRVQNK